MKPTKPITDPAFAYVPSIKTDIAATWERLVPGWRKRKVLPGPRTVVALMPRERKGKA